MKLDEYRNQITLHLTRISSDIEHIKECNSKVEKHLSKLNDRTRKTENSIALIKGVGLVCSVIFSGLFTYLLINI